MPKPKDNYVTEVSLFTMFEDPDLAGEPIATVQRNPQQCAVRFYTPTPASIRRLTRIAIRANRRNTPGFCRPWNSTGDTLGWVVEF